MEPTARTEGTEDQTTRRGDARILGARDGTGRLIGEMSGIDDRSAAKLRRIGILTVDDLWARAGDRSGRQQISGVTGIDEHRLSSWAKRADLMQVRSIGPRDAALLEMAGITTLKQLRNRRPDSLIESLEEANRTHRILTSMPSEETAAAWIEEADAIVA